MLGPLNALHEGPCLRVRLSEKLNQCPRMIFAIAVTTMWN
jgi:hypothetical protein